MILIKEMNASSLRKPDEDFVGLITKEDVKSLFYTCNMENVVLRKTNQ